MSDTIDNISFPLNHLQDSIDKLALNSYRKGLVDAASLCRLKANEIGENTTTIILRHVRNAHLADAAALLELAQSLVEIPKP